MLSLIFSYPSAIEASGQERGISRVSGDEFSRGERGRVCLFAMLFFLRLMAFRKSQAAMEEEGLLGYFLFDGI